MIERKDLEARSFVDNTESVKSKGEFLKFRINNKIKYVNISDIKKDCATLIWKKKE